jgi:hypothetical protein
MKIRNISSASSPIVPEKVYENADIQQDQILSENRGKAGIYKWTNKIHGKTYIGSLPPPPGERGGASPRRAAPRLR